MERISLPSMFIKSMQKGEEKKISVAHFNSIYISISLLSVSWPALEVTHCPGLASTSRAGWAARCWAGHRWSLGYVHASCSASPQPAPCMSPRASIGAGWEVCFELGFGWAMTMPGQPISSQSGPARLHCSSSNTPANVSHGYCPKQNPYLFLTPSKAVFW